MKFGENKLSESKNPAAEQLESYLEQLDSWVTESNSNYASFHGEYIEAANMSMGELKNLTQEDIFDYAYLLQGYATYLQDEVNRHQVIADWCNNQIETLVQKHRSEFGQYQKHEQRRYQLVSENTFVHKVNSMLQVAQSRLTSLNGKIWELKQKSNILLEKGKRL